ncbi:MAG: chemotaxis protein CheA [Spirochaetes bacterium]|nr:chemotaxis protein CheA [Spirochaetota bacterium]
MNSEIRDIFLEESRETLMNLESDIVSLEGHFDRELFNNIFRYVHTLKGSSGVAGVNSVYEFSHQLENLMDLVRSERIVVSETIIDLLLDSLDYFKLAIFGTDEEIEESEKMKEGLLSRIFDCITEGTGKAQGADEKRPAVAPARDERYFHIHVRFKEDIYENGIDPLRIIQDCCAQGDLLERAVDRSALPDFPQLDPEKCYLAWDLLIRTEKSRREMQDVFIFVRDDNEIVIEDVTEEYVKEKELPAADVKIGELLMDRGIINAEDYDSILEAQAQENKKFGEIVVERGYASENDMSRALKEQDRMRKKLESSTVRVDTVKLDNLMNLLGEIVIGQSSLSRIAEELEDETEFRLKNALHGLDRITREFQEQIMAIRMIPVGPTFEQFRRFVRDQAKASGKEISLVIEGRETELDKTVIEKIGDPLKHMIRNAVDHGIETAEERKERGKNPAGSIRLGAYHQEGYVYIEVADDGRGISLQRVREKAEVLGFLHEGDEASEARLLSFLFIPGFSTAEKVGDLSGRGVGMDVVRTNIESLRGSVEILNQEGEGTTVQIKLPLTLAIIEGMMVRVGKSIYIIPLLSIVESLRPAREALKTVEDKGEVVMVRNEYVTLVRLYDLFGIPADCLNPWEGLVVIVESGEEKVGILVDELMGQQQIVIRSLDVDMTRSRALSGATVLGDGRVALIIDVHGLVGELTRRQA